MIAERQDRLFTGLTDFREVIAQLLNQVDEDELGVAVKLLSLSVTDVWVQLLAEACQKSDRTLAYADDFVPNRVPDYCHRSNKSLPEIIQLLS